MACPQDAAAAAALQALQQAAQREQAAWCRQHAASDQPEAEQAYKQATAKLPGNESITVPMWVLSKADTVSTYIGRGGMWEPAESQAFLRHLAAFAQVWPSLPRPGLRARLHFPENAAAACRGPLEAATMPVWKLAQPVSAAASAARRRRGLAAGAPTSRAQPSKPNSYRCDHACRTAACSPKMWSCSTLVPTLGEAKGPRCTLPHTAQAARHALHLSCSQGAPRQRPAHASSANHGVRWPGTPLRCARCPDAA